VGRSWEGQWGWHFEKTVRSRMMALKMAFIKDVEEVRRMLLEPWERGVLFIT
jgi:hypothetical protein